MNKRPNRFSPKKKTPRLPVVYKEEEINIIEEHIHRRFGKFESVFHEIVSPDIHVDIALIPPSEERGYNTLVTMGMGAYCMNVPKELAGQKLNRAEMLICLPSDWKFNSEAEEWYWPVRWLKIMARLPLEQHTWLGFGHTVPNGEPFAGNTKLSGMLVSSPVQFSKESYKCDMPDGSQVTFYQLIPLYDEEMNYKLQNNAEALLDKMTIEMKSVLNINRLNVVL